MSVRVCPVAACSEWNEPAAIWCHQCGSRLIPQERTLARVRAAIGFTSKDVDPDEHAAMIVAAIEARQVKPEAAA